MSDRFVNHGPSNKFQSFAKGFRLDAVTTQQNDLIPANTVTNTSMGSYSLKVCMYRAMSGAVYGTNDPMKIIEQMRPLIEFFKVPYDENIWGPVMAYVYGFSFVGSFGSRPDFLKFMKEQAEGTFFLIMSARSDADSGHALYARKDAAKKGAKMEYIDNENNDYQPSTEPASKFNEKFEFIVFKRGEQSTDARQIPVRLGLLPEKLLRLLVKSHNLYAAARVNNEPVSVGGDAVEHFDKNTYKKLYAAKFGPTKANNNDKTYQKFSQDVNKLIKSSWTYANKTKPTN